MYDAKRWQFWVSCVPKGSLYPEAVMSFPIKTCVVCSEEFELRPGKPGFANRCPECTEQEAENTSPGNPLASKADAGLNEARRSAMRDLLYRKDS